jgi:hypothetical protein
MGEGGDRVPVAVFSRHWRTAGSEAAYAMRTLAGATSRTGPTSVYVPGPPGAPEPDGAFDVIGIGGEPGEGWPLPGSASGLGPLPAGSAAIVDDLTESVLPLLDALGPEVRRFALPGTAGPAASGGASQLALVPSASGGDHRFVGLHVPINPLAAGHRHNGFGFVDYLLVLSGRLGHHDQPVPEVAWLTAGFPDDNIVVIEDAQASVWRGRALRGVVSVDSRTDLWRLVAHARACIDSAPGALLARECIESLRFGTPIIVPRGAGAAAAHAAAGGGLAYGNVADLLDHARAVGNPATRARLSDGGKRYADETYGDPSTFVSRVASALSGADALR